MKAQQTIFFVVKLLCASPPPPQPSPPSSFCEYIVLVLVFHVPINTPKVSESSVRTADELDLAMD